MTPEEQAGRLFNRIMLLHTQGKTDSVRFFAPMAMQAFQMLQDRAPLTLDQRYELGRIAEVAGAVPFSKAQADSILQVQPTHLLGLALASRLAQLVQDSTALAAFDKRLLAAERAELSKRLTEYTAHEDDIKTAIADARRRAR